MIPKFTPICKDKGHSIEDVNLSSYARCKSRPPPIRECVGWRFLVTVARVGLSLKTGFPRFVLPFQLVLIKLFWSTWTLQEFHNCPVYSLKGRFGRNGIESVCQFVENPHTASLAFSILYNFSLIFLLSSVGLAVISSRRKLKNFLENFLV